MFFRRTIQRYAQTSDPVTPYQRAEQVWDDRIGSARIQAANWRFAAFGAIGLSALLAGGMIWLSAQSRVVPYVVEVDKLGDVRALGPANNDFRPSDPQIAWYLARFITNVRALSSDPVIVRQNWLQAYDYTTDHGGSYLNEFARANDPFSEVGTRTVTVQITSVTRATDNTFQVKWQEQTYKQGSLEKTANWTGMLTVVLQTPRSAAALRKNPLGVYVNNLAWSEELSPINH